MAQEYGNRVWSGDPTTVAEARAKYQADTEGQLIPFAVALYSFRTNRKFAEELLELRQSLITYAQDLIRYIPRDEKGWQELASKIDVLSTYFEWMSRQHQLTSTHREEIHEFAEGFCTHGIGFIYHYKPKQGDHTWSLLTLTSARLWINKKKYLAALGDLYNVSKFGTLITDTKQRARVYAKLGFLYRKCGKHIPGIYWGVRACLVPGVPMNVRAKCIAALFDIDR